MPRTLAFDVTRLFIGPLRAAPRGIDRVDISYMHHVFERWPGPCVGILPTPWGVRFYGRERVLRGFGVLKNLWNEARPESDDVLFRALRDWLSKPPSPFEPAGAKPGRREARPVRGFVDVLKATGFAFGRSAKGHLPPGALYLNTGQVGLALPLFNRWLDKRKDVVTVVMLHDVIPLEVPELVLPAAPRYHANMVAATSRHANGLIVTTEAAGDAIRRFIDPSRSANLRVASAHLPIAPVFLKPVTRDPALARIPYFVVCGAIEMRKNHRLLFRIWSDFVARLGAGAPKLVLVGSPAWGGAAILADLAADATLANHVAVARGLATAGLRDLVAHATALLAPSFAEGFGLPIVEALALGTPVIASALPAHAEAARGRAILLDPRDTDGWRQAIETLLTDAEVLAAARHRAQGFEIMTWNDYFGIINPFLHSF